MSTKQNIQLGIQIELKNPDSGNLEQLDHLSSDLYNEIRQLNIESVEAEMAGPSPADTKGLDAVLIGTWIVKLAPTVITALLGLLKDWTARHPTTPLKIKVKRGRRTVEIEYDPSKITPAQLEKMTNRLLK